MKKIVSSGGINTGAKKLERNKGKKLPKSDWKNILKNEETSVLEKGLVVYGMSLHTMSDTFAHSCMGHLGNGSSDSDAWVWADFSKLAYKEKKDGLSANDNPMVCPQRYWYARQAVLNSMDRIKISTNADIMTIEKTKTIDFCSRKRYLNIRKKIKENDVNKKFSDEAEIQYNNLVANTKYYHKRFGICNIYNNVKECKKGSKSKNKTPDQYLKKRDIDMSIIESKSRNYSVAKIDYFMSGAKDDTEVSVNVSIRNIKTDKTVRILEAKGPQNGTFCCALNNSIIKNPDIEYVVESNISGQKAETIINSDTPFKETKETDEDTVVLMETWDIDGNIQSFSQVELTGLVMEVDENGRYGNIIEGAEVSVQYDNGGNKTKSDMTGSDGRYTMADLAPGSYKLTVAKEGYLTATQYLELNGMSERYQNMTIPLIKESCGTGTATGRIRNSSYSDDVSGLRLKLREGFDNTCYGEVLRSACTLDYGNYSFSNLPAGYYCIEIIDDEDRYIDTYFNVYVTEKTGEIRQDGIVSEILPGEQMHITMTFYGSVWDLEPHMVGTSEDFHVWRFNEQYQNSNGELIAELDRFGTSSYYGYDTITVYNPNVSFVYYAYNGRGGDHLLQYSNATVKIYMGNRLIYVYYVPLGLGTIWEVFSYDGNTGQITPLGKIHNERTKILEGYK